MKCYPKVTSRVSDIRRRNWKRRKMSSEGILWSTAGEGIKVTWLSTGGDLGVAGTRDHQGHFTWIHHKEQSCHSREPTTQIWMNATQAGKKDSKWLIILSMCVRLMALENVYQVFERMPACVWYLLALDGLVFWKISWTKYFVLESHYYWLFIKWHRIPMFYGWKITQTTILFPGSWEFYVNSDCLIILKKLFPFKVKSWCLAIGCIYSSWSICP